MSALKFRENLKLVRIVSMRAKIISDALRSCQKAFRDGKNFYARDERDAGHPIKNRSDFRDM